MALLDNTASILIQAFQGPWQGKWKNWFRIDRWCIKEFFLMWESLRDFSFYGHLMPLFHFKFQLNVTITTIVRWRHNLEVDIPNCIFFSFFLLSMTIRTLHGRFSYLTRSCSVSSYDDSNIARTILYLTKLDRCRTRRKNSPRVRFEPSTYRVYTGA